MSYSSIKIADEATAKNQQFDVEPIENIYRVTKVGEPLRIIAYRSINAAGDYGSEYAAELLFSSKKDLQRWFRKRHIEVQEIEDHEGLPF